MKNFTLKIFIAFLLFFIIAKIQAQVTIGADQPPKPQSVLELRGEYKTGVYGGIRLPQLTTAERELITGLDDPASFGLMIYNTTINCVQFWNSHVWISLCEMEDTPVPVTITGGKVTTYTNVMYDFQNQILEAYNNINSDAPIAWQWKISTSANGTYTDIPGATAATFKVPADFMYGYMDRSDLTQKSKELFFKCQITTAASTMLTADADALGILFIRTTDANGNPVGGYGIDGTGNGVHYLTIGKGEDGKTVPQGSAGTIKMALLNLGASGTGGYRNGLQILTENINDFDNAGDLGDFYQWGRWEDGHEHINWSKNTNHVNTIATAGTSSVIKRSSSDIADPSLYIDAATGQVILGTNYYGKYIPRDSANMDWSWNSSDYIDRWGNKLGLSNNSGMDRNNVPVAINKWTTRGKGNNPCPVGWYVPSRYDFADIYTDDGTGVNGKSGSFGDFNNKWEWRNTSNYAYGGIIITNAAGEKLFMPALSYRSSSSGDLNGNAGAAIYYWSSTHDDNPFIGYPSYNNPNAYGMYYNPPNGNLVIDAGFDAKPLLNSTGIAIRCVKEEPEPLPPVNPDGADDTPPPGFTPYVGAFWKYNQTGERLIRITAPGNGAANGKWAAQVVVGANWIILDKDMTADPNVGWRTDNNPNELFVQNGNDAGFDIANKVSGNATAVTGTLDANNPIYFRIGLKDTIPAGTHRYGIVVLTYKGNTLTQRIWIRQGEEPDYLMRPSDDINSGGFTGSGPNARPSAAKFSPYNLTVAAAGLNTQAGLNGANPNPGIFTQYPSQSGAFFQWASNSFARNAWDAYNTEAPTGITDWWNIANGLTDYWKGGVSTNLYQTHETCPDGYHRPTDGATNASTGNFPNPSPTNTNVQDSEIRQSLYLNPQSGITPTTGNSSWGYYADGFFDRRQITAGPGTQASLSTNQSTVAASLPTIANVGQLFYNPNPNSYASLFFPAAGNRYDGPPLNGGALFGMGDYGFYWSSSANQTNSAWALAFIKSVTYPNDLSRSYGFNIRCVKE